MALGPNLFIFIIGTWFAAVEGIKIPGVAALQDDRSLPHIDSIVFDIPSPGSANTRLNISISPEVTELGSNYFPNLTSDMGIQIKTPYQITNMKCDVFGAEKPLLKQRRLFRDPRAIRDSRDLRFRGRETSSRSRELTFNDVEMRACVKNSTLIKLNIFEKRKVQEYVNCARIPHWYDSIYLELKISKIQKGWCCGGMANATEFLESRSKALDGLWLYLESTGIREIPSDAFENEIYWERVVLRRNNLINTEIIANWPATLKQLDLTHNNISELKANSFSHLPKLRYIDLEYNQITLIEHHAFANNKNLATLYLSNNLISYLKEGVFTGLSLLHTLDLASNLLTSIPANVFNFVRLTSLDLSLNNITVIESGALKSLCDPNIDSYTLCSIRLNITGNPIESLQNGALFGLPKISDCNVWMKDTPMKFIGGGVFDNFVP